MSRSVRRVVMALGVMALLPAWAFAQDRQVTGQVTDQATGAPMAGAQVVVKGTTIGTLSDGSGNYSIRVPESSNTLVFSYIGYGTVEAEVAGTVVNAALAVQPLGLEGIVVTALGLQREKRDLGYAVQDVSGEDLAEVPDLNLVSALSGQVAGVTVRNTGPTGGSARIVLRGATSITGNNQPLFIVDGIPVDNSSPTNNGFGGGSGDGIDYGNAVADINTADIASVSVLKGANAAALYGSRAANGAIVITTKSGEGAGGTGLGITASLGTTFQQPLRVPKFQNLYGQGFNGEFQFVDGAGAGTNDHADESWGPPLDGQPIDQFFGQQQPWVAHPDNIRNFFETGVTTNLHVALARATERSHVRLSVANTNVDGMYPSNVLEKRSVTLNGGVDITERLSAEASLNYFRTEGEDRPGTGYSGINPLQQLYSWVGRQIDIERLRDFKCDEGDYACTPDAQFNWNYNYHNNPFWIAQENKNFDDRDRMIGHVALNYQVTDWLTATVRSGRDWYEENRKRTFARYSLDTPFGAFAQDRIFRSETNTDLLLTARRGLTPDLTVTVNAGVNRRDNEYLLNSTEVDELSMAGIYSVANARSTPDVSDWREQRRINSVLGLVNFNYRDFLSVDVTGRNDWSSTLPEESNSFFYPSVSGALIFTDAFGIGSDLLSSGKVRASWTRVGNDTDPFRLVNSYPAGTAWGGIPSFTVDNELANPVLKPEEITSWEVGTDLGFFNERLGFAVTYYDGVSRNQILPVQVSRASGYTGRILNAGEMRDWGWELVARARPVQLDNSFTWDLTLNWAKKNNEVVSLYGDLENIVLNAGGYWSLNIEARRGEPYGVLVGNKYLRNDDGVLLLNDDGLPQRDPTPQVLGNYHPDWTAGFINRFSYKDFDLSVVMNTQQGGELFSTTVWWGLYTGVLEETLEGRENGVCDPGVAVEGIIESTGQPTTIRPCAQDYWHATYPTHERGIVDASFIKLREVRLGYSMPESFVQRLGFSDLNLAVIGRNLWLHADSPHIDPETAFDASNVQGIEYAQFPTARSIGFTVSVRP